MCHLLADLSVPAHTHRDEHGLTPDAFENWVADDTEAHLVWNHTNAGELVIPHTSDDNPLHYLMYTMHQPADRFDSSGPDECKGNKRRMDGRAPAECA